MNHEIITETIRNSEIALYLREGLLYDIEIDNPKYPLYSGLIISGNRQKHDKERGFTIFKNKELDQEFVVRDMNASDLDHGYFQISKEARPNKIAEAQLSEETNVTERRSACDRLHDKYNANVTTEPDIIDLRGCWEMLQDLQSAEVSLPNNKGSIAIDETRALTAIDVDLGAANNHLTVNISAAKLIAKHIKLRRLSGLIMVDFIRMQKDKHKQDLIKALEAQLSTLGVNAVIHGFTRTGVLEITKKKNRTPLSMLLNDFLL